MGWIKVVIFIVILYVVIRKNEVYWYVLISEERLVGKENILLNIIYKLRMFEFLKYEIKLFFCIFLYEFKYMR